MCVPDRRAALPTVLPARKQKGEMNAYQFIEIAAYNNDYGNGAYFKKKIITMKRFISNFCY